MLSFRKTLNFITSFVFLLSLISVSGFTSVSTNIETPKTEIVERVLIEESTSNAHYKTSTKTYKTETLNPFATFNFKCILNIHSFYFTLTLKSQKELTRQFLNNLHLEQNLIAQIKASKHKATS